MAGRGSAPKPTTQRRRRNEPMRGEWKALDPHDNPVPDMPKGSWSERTERAWTAWWSDPASSEWGEADRSLVETLIFTYEEWVVKGGPSLVTQVRQIMDTLGLTPKGRQDRRWKLPDPAEVVDIEPARSAAERMADLRERAAAAEGSA